MKNKVNLSGITIGAAALLVGLAGNVQAIPITHHDFSARQSARVSAQGNRNLSPASLTASMSPNPIKVKQTRGRQTPVVRLTVAFGQGAFPVNALQAPLLPASPVNLPPSPRPVGASVAASAENGVGVPDGGATAALLAGSLGGLAIFRKKLKA